MLKRINENKSHRGSFHLGCGYLHIETGPTIIPFIGLSCSDKFPEQTEGYFAMSADDIMELSDHLQELAIGMREEATS